MTTANTIIARALRLIGVFGAGESAGAQEAADGLEALNDMIAGWTAKRLLIYSVNQVTATLAIGTNSYTIGPAGVIATARPTSVERAFIRVSGVDYPLASLTRDQYMARITKSVTSLPSGFYYDADLAAGTLYLWPAPALAYVLYFDAVQPFTAFAALTSDAQFPPEYDRLLKYGLAVEIAPEYGKTVSPDVREAFMDSMRSIKNNNSSVTPARFDIGVRGRPFNWRTGE